MAKLKKIQKSQINFNGTMALSQDAVMSRLNCHNIGKILEFDAVTQTCTVELQQIKQFNEKLYTPAPITQVPLIILGAGGGHITMPNPVGTICLLLFLDRNIDAFLETGEPYTPETTRMHDFTDCVALTTFKTLVNPLADYDERAISIFNDEIIENIKNNSFIKVNPDNIVLKSVQTVTEDDTENISSGILTVYKDGALIESTLGSQIGVTDKINIKNTAQSLATLIQAFITACEGIVTINGGALTPASKQTFTDLKAQFEELLQ